MVPEWTDHWRGGISFHEAIVVAVVLVEGRIELLAPDGIFHVPHGGIAVGPSRAFIGIGFHVGLGGVRPGDGQFSRVGYLGNLDPDFGSGARVPVLDFVLQFAAVVVVYAKVEPGAVPVLVLVEEAVVGESVDIGVV